MGISDFRISGQFLIKENCHISRINDNIDMKHEPLTKLDKWKKINNGVLSANCDIIVIFPIYGQFGAIQKSDTKHMVCKTYI